jgi:hypothetical protein
VFAGAYTFSVISSATIVPGVTDTGNHTSAIVSSIGNIQFTGNGSAFSNTSLPNVSDTTGGGEGIFTSTSGAPGGQIFQ